MLVLKRFTNGVWFDFPDYPGVKFKIKPATPSSLGKLVSKIRTKVSVKVEKEDENNEDDINYVDDVDKIVLAFDIFNYVLEEYKGIKLETDDKSEPTDKEIREVLYDNTKIKTFILDKANELFEKTSNELESEVKN